MTTRRVVYRRDSGFYCDCDESHGGARKTDRALIESSNVIGRFGGVPADYVVVETDDPAPWMLRWDAGELIPDAAKVQEFDEAAAARIVETERRAAIAGRLEAGTATMKEVQEVLRGLMS